MLAVTSLHHCSACGVAASSHLSEVAVVHRRTGEKKVLVLCDTCRTGESRTWRLAWEVEDE